MKTYKQTAVALCAGISVLAISSIAHAQSAPGDATGAKLDEVVVTGSRVIRNGDDSPTPVTVVTADQLAMLRPATIAESLNDLPVFAGSAGQFSATASRNQNQAVNSNSGNFLNLRALGLTRTLVLYDGHRVPPTTPDALVDVDMIPQMLLQRVDVVTGGASAVYGSDAIGGVVNFITNRKFSGLKLNLQAGTSELRDGATRDAGLAFGASLFGGRGHVMGSIQYRKDDGIDDRLSREWGRQLVTLQGAGNAAAPYIFVYNTHLTNATFGGRINTGGGTLNGQQFTNGGVLVPFVAGNTAGIAPGVAIQSGGDGAYQVSILKAPLEMKQAYGRFDFDVSDNVHFYASASAAENYVFVKGGYLATQNNTALSVRNAYLAPQYQAQFANPAATFTVGRVFNDIERQSSDSRSKQLYLNTGLDGEFGSGYKWDVSLTHGSAEQNNRNFTNRNLGRYAAALDAVVNPATGQVVCNVSLNPTTAALFPGCVPLNIFGNGSASQAAVNYLYGTTSVRPKTEMDDVAASVSGAPFSTWAGPVDLALSAEWRKLSYSAVSTTDPAALLNCAALGLRYNCTATTNPWSNPVPSRSEVSQTVKEVALEAGVPLLKDKPFVQSLDVNAAARYTDYDTSGGVTTWKLGSTWDVNDQLTLRASRSHDIRAPNLDELYRLATIATNGTNFPDRLTNANYTALGSVVLVSNSGNPNLKPEKADTSTLGIVYRPIPKLSVAIDAFDITINDVIFSVQGNDPTAQDSCYASGGSSPYCSLQIRPLGFTNKTTANVVTQWIQSPLNFARMKTRGVDFEVNYATSIAGHALTLRGLATNQPHIYYLNPGAARLDLAGTSFSGSGYPPTARWRATVLASFQPTESLTVSLTGRWRSSLGHTPDPTSVVAQSRVPSAAFANLNISNKMKIGRADADIFLNVQNLFNKQPPTASFFGSANSPGSSTTGGFVAGDDPIGRYFTAGIRLSM